MSVVMLSMVQKLIVPWIFFEMVIDQLMVFLLFPCSGDDLVSIVLKLIVRWMWFAIAVLLSMVQLIMVPCNGDIVLSMGLKLIVIGYNLEM